LGEEEQVVLWDAGTHRSLEKNVGETEIEQRQNKVGTPKGVFFSS